MSTQDRRMQYNMIVIYYIGGILMLSLTASCIPQNPVETIGVGLMMGASSVLDAFQEGTMIKKGHSIDTPVGTFGANSELGFGRSARKSGAKDSSEEDRRKRRKRDIDNLEFNDLMAEENILPLGPYSHIHLHRNKRSPCFGGTNTGMGGTDTDVIDEEARRRALRRKAAQRKRSTNGKTGKKTNQKSKKLVEDEEHSRRKRQTELDDLAGGDQQQNGGKIQKFAQQIGAAIETFVHAMRQGIEKLKTAFTGNGQSGMQPNPNDNLS